MKKLLAAITAIFICCAAFAQEPQFPRAVLVQLRSEHNRVDALTKQRRYKQVEDVKAEAKKISDAMIGDFHDNFRFCPVYYYMDTNLDLVLKQQFDGILLDEHYKPASNVIVHPNDTDYLIVFYGFPVVQSYGTRTVTDSTKYMANSGEPFGRGLIINNYKMQQVHYYYKLAYQDIFFGKRKKNIKYLVTSDHYDMEYYPFAQSFQKLLRTNWRYKYQSSSED